MSRVSFDSVDGKSVVRVDRRDSVSQHDYIHESNRRASRFFRRRLDDRFYIDDTRKYEKPSLSYRLYLYLYSGKRLYITEGIQAILNTVWCILYVYETYQESLSTWNIIVDYVFASVLLVFFLLYLFTIQRRIKFLLSFYAIIDYFTIFPSFFAVQLVPELRHLAILRIVRVTRFTSLITNRTYKNISKVIGIVVCFLFIVTSLLLIFEEALLKNFHNALYFAVITISTVGYGDYSPESTAGKFLIIFTIITAIVLIPIQGYLLSRVFFESVDPYDKRFVPSRKRHILITGNNIRRIRIENFIDELLLKYNAQTRDISIIILQPDPPTRELESLWDEYSEYVEFYQGDPTNHKDLQRVAAERAQVIVLFGDSYLHGNMFDRDIIFTNLSIKSYCNTVPIFTYLARPENETALLSTCLKDSKEIDDELVDKYNGIFIVPQNELKMTIIGHTLICKGFCTLISNLLRTEFEGFENSTFVNESDEEYIYGGNHEFYFGPLKYFQNTPFYKAVLNIYKHHNAILVGLLLEKVVVLNPYDHIIEGHELGFFIAINSIIPESLSTEPMVEQKIEHPVSRNLIKSGVNKYLIAAKNEINNLSESQIQESGFYRLIKEKTEFLSLHCHILHDPPKDMNVLVDAHKLKDHIVIYGYIEDYIHLIRPLRSRAVKKIKPILIVTNGPFPVNEWEDISIFPDIYIMNGEFSHKYDLIRANIEDASDIIISYNYPESIMTLDQQFRETAIAYLSIKKSYPYANVIIDIEDENQLRLFHTKPIDPLFYPDVKSGSIFPRTLIDRLMAQGVFNPYILNLITNLSVFHATKGSDKKEYPNNNIILLELPRKLADRTFLEVFRYFLKKKNSICIGLYRIRFNRHLMEKEEFVYTCPKSDTIVTKDDRIYLLTSLKS